ncbi:MAG: DNA double-strand break repair nuclease NurA, partial [Anaerolineaceae bacterium]
MPINYQQINNQISHFCELTAEHNQVIQSTTILLLDTLKQYSDQVCKLIGLVDTESTTNKTLRCAKPTNEALASVHSLPALDIVATLIAADGSQINPSRHRQVDFCLINIATISMQTGMDAAPLISTESLLLDIGELTPHNTPLTEDILALERDIRERAALARQAHKYTPPLITITDGPLELFRETSNSTRFEKKLVEYIDILSELSKSRAITVGYVDKPQSDLVNRLLKLIIKNDSQAPAQAIRALEHVWVSDATLFSEVLRSPGDRSAIYCIQSSWSTLFKEDLALYFFYLNVSRSVTPYLARVEIPAWCTRDPEILDQLHAAIYRQCDIMG